MIKMKTHPVIIIIIFAVLCINVISYIDRIGYEKKAQMFHSERQQTEELKIILREAGKDQTMDNIKTIAGSRNEFKVESVLISKPYTTMGADKKALKVNETILLFKDGVFEYEIEANTTNHQQLSQKNSK
jgi:hypothetical protein